MLLWSRRPNCATTSLIGNILFDVLIDMFCAAVFEFISIRFACQRLVRDVRWWWGLVTMRIDSYTVSSPSSSLSRFRFCIHPGNNSFPCLLGSLSGRGEGEQLNSIDNNGTLMAICFYSLSCLHSVPSQCLLLDCVLKRAKFTNADDTLLVTIAIEKRSA